MPILALARPPALEELVLSGRRRLRLGARIGSGTSTVVRHGAIEVEDGAPRDVAVKLFQVERDVLRGLGLAAERAACVVHPHVVATYDFDLRVEAPTPFLVMELVRGVTLRSWLDSHASAARSVPFEVALQIGLDVASALAAAWLGRHPTGRPIALPHGGLSARDVHITAAGVVKVGDFGMTPRLELSSGIHPAGEIAERLAMIAPEVAAGRAADARADVFSLGVLLHELLAAPRFARASSLAEAIQMLHAGTVYEDPFSLHHARPLRGVLRRAVDPRPEKRFADAGELHAELSRIAKLLGVTSGPIPMIGATSVLAG